MPIVHLNRSPNKGVTISRINKRSKTIIRLQVRLGVGNLGLGEGLCQCGAEIGKFKASGSPRQKDFA